jgi:hypothetical protein
MQKANAQGGVNRVSADVQLRPFPYPYRAMLAICSDLDETPDRHAYWEIMRFLNTTEETTMGPGVGLEVGNSIYFDMPPEQFAYWNTDDAGREMIRARSPAKRVPKLSLKTFCGGVSNFFLCYLFSSVRKTATFVL